MIAFSMHFLFCNILISAIIGAILLLKKISGNCLSGCTQYHIWFLLPVVLAVPFLSIRPAGLSYMITWLRSMQAGLLPETPTQASLAVANQTPATDWLYDFRIYAAGNPAPVAGYIPLVIWVGGMIAMTVFVLNSRIHLYRLEQSALPLQSTRTQLLYQNCRAELHVKREIPVYSTAFLKSPIMVGVFRPRIYLPIHLISDFKESDIRYMLLHELQHYKHKDAFVNCLMNLITILYWFNPVVWYAVQEVRTDREIACDTFVLQVLDSAEYTAYGNTLLNFAHKISLFPFSLATGIGGSAKQIKKRILNIASYKPQTKWLKIRERIVLAVLIVLILESTTLIPVLASDTRAPLPENAHIQTEDLSGFFADYEGCFVLYDTNADIWDIYNEPLATKRFPPNSTYKIYSALFALENQLIRPTASTLKWNGQSYSYPAWNQDQTLASAMRNSVNWYFQELDQRADWNALKTFYHTIGYGNQDLSGGAAEFWMESSLKISAVEQVELLKKLYANAFCFDSANIQAVKDSLRLSASGQAVLSGKTGTGIINGESINGWFIGYVESDDNTWFFATNIQGANHADSLTAGEITRNILAAKHIYTETE
ncbi:MAG: BlaR1 family beta-lactam sensor/signal transducer [Lachnospiraceae bacterium]|nr:BlaR1 family beta-lactam sensor/signal transducer [Lachnospiraceae bacterium]